jgi:hypothetical protein
MHSTYMQLGFYNGTHYFSNVVKYIVLHFYQSVNGNLLHLLGKLIHASQTLNIPVRTRHFHTARIILQSTASTHTQTSGLVLLVTVIEK